jgi:hypothetical protein
MKKFYFEIRIEFFLFLNFEKNLAIPPEGNEQIWKRKRFWNLKKCGHTTIKGKWKMLKYATKISNEKIEISFLKFEMKKLKIFIFEIWSQNFRLKFDKQNWPYY